MKNLLLIAVISAFLSSCSDKQSKAEAEPFLIATYNLRLANHGDSLNGNGWGTRLPHIADLIRFHGFEIFGTQEGFKYMLEELKEQLPEYDYIGVGRDNGADEGEHAAIFYDKNRFEVKDHGDFWLSQTPDSVSFGWDAACRRVCTWGKFLDKQNGDEFLYYNLHMDHIGTVARAESAKLILQKIMEREENLPVILSGDFNVDQNSESYNLLNDSRQLHDSYELAGIIYAPTGTFNNFNPDSFTSERIDHIFVSPEFEVIKYGILTDTYRSPNVVDSIEETPNFPKEVILRQWTSRTPSDHYPVVIKVKRS